MVLGKNWLCASITVYRDFKIPKIKLTYFHIAVKALNTVRYKDTGTLYML